MVWKVISPIHHIKPSLPPIHYGLPVKEFSFSSSAFGQKSQNNFLFVKPSWKKKHKWKYTVFCLLSKKMTKGKKKKNCLRRTRCVTGQG